MTIMKAFVNNVYMCITVRKLMAQWLRLVSQGHELYCP